MQQIRSSSGWRRQVAVVGVLALALVACGGDDDDDAGSDAASDPASDADGGAEPAAEDAGGGSGGGGTLVLGDETISLDSARCFLEEQEAAAGGGKILFVAQGFGTNAAGEDVTLDVSRYDEDSQFAGDDVLVDIGDVLAGESVGLRASGAIGTVTVDGSTLSADGLTFTNFDDATQRSGSFEINC